MNLLTQNSRTYRFQHRNRKQTSGCLALGVEGEMFYRGAWESFGVMEIIVISWMYNHLRFFF